MYILITTSSLTLIIHTHYGTMFLLMVTSIVTGTNIVLLNRNFKQLRKNKQMINLKIL